MRLPRLGRTSWLLAAGAAAFVMTLVGNVPAALLRSPLAGAGITVQSLRGTVWRGEALGLSVAGTRVPRLTWRVAVLRLLQGRLQAAIDARLPGEGFAMGAVAVSLGGLRAENLTAAAALADLVPAARGLGAGSQIRVKLGEFAWQAGWPTALTGTVDLVDVDPTFGAVPTGSRAPGRFTAEFAAASIAPGEPIRGDLKDAGGPLELDGTLTLSPPAAYTLEGRARARPGAPPDLAQGLALLGPADASGLHQISVAGSL